MTTGGRGHPRPPVASKASDTSPLSTLTAVLLTLIPWSGTAVAHGSVVDPASRNYGCWDRWGDDFQNPAMADEDPMRNSRPPPLPGAPRPAGVGGVPSAGVTGQTLTPKSAAMPARPEA
jgi:hypothetical protein